MISKRKQSSQESVSARLVYFRPDSMAARFNPYGRPSGSSQRGRGRGRSFRGHLHHFHRRRFMSDEDPLPPMNVPPPKPIPTVRFENRSPSPVRSDTQPYNFVANWLAKNTMHNQRKKEVIVIDESDTDSATGTTTKNETRVKSEQGGPSNTRDCIAENQTNSMQQSVKQCVQQRSLGSVEVIDITESDDDCVVVSPVKKTEDLSWSSDESHQSTSSASTIKIQDGYSKYCKFKKKTGRSWEICERSSLHNQTTNASSSTFTVCSYNVLCQKTLARTHYLYSHLYDSPQFLDWDHRWKGLREELTSFNADIMGLQEVQAEHFVENFDPLLKTLRYQGHYKRKSGTELKDDGCALFYKPEKFEELKYAEVDYFIAPNAISNRENIGQILALRCRVTNEVILVANTHLLFNTERGDVKLAQLAILFAHIDKMRKEFGNYHPLVMVMGDFNMEVHSQVYNFIVNGNLRVHNEPVRTMSGQSRRSGGVLCDAQRLLENTVYGMDSTIQTAGQRPSSDGFIRHPFKFSSAYHQKANLYEKRPISTYHKDSATPDFIFFTRETSELGVDRLQLVEKYNLPTIDVLFADIPWPNEHTPSDHIPLIAKFTLQKA